MPDPVSPNPSVSMETPNTDDNGPLVYYVPPERQAEYEAYSQDLEFAFGGTDPLEWVGHLHQRLTYSSRNLAIARSVLDDETKDFEDDAAALADVRLKAALVIAELYQMLSAMPLMQSAPEALEGLRYVLTSIHDVERGAAPAWLVAKSTKKHPARSIAQTEWMFIVICVQLLRLLPKYHSEKAASEKISSRIDRPVTTIKRWCRKLYCPTRHTVPAARARIESELQSIRVLLKLVPSQNHAAIIERRIAELLP